MNNIIQNTEGKYVHSARRFIQMNTRQEISGFFERYIQELKGDSGTKRFEYMLVKCDTL
jgi:hypothetical protein